MKKERIEELNPFLPNDKIVYSHEIEIDVNIS